MSVQSNQRFVTPQGEIKITIEVMTGRPENKQETTRIELEKQIQRERDNIRYATTAALTRHTNSTDQVALIEALSHALDVLKSRSNEVGSSDDRTEECKKVSGLLVAACEFAVINAGI
jgi:hypothetical protein